MGFAGSGAAGLAKICIQPGPSGLGQKTGHKCNKKLCKNGSEKNYIKLYKNGFVKTMFAKTKKKRSHSLLQTLRTCYLGQFQLFGVLISEVFTILSQTPVLGVKT